MMTNQDVLTVYAAMGELTSQMVTAANESDWDRLEALEQRMSAHVALLKTSEGSVKLEGEQRQRKVSLIKQMLADDRKVRDMIEPWMAHLSKLINSTGTERRVVNAYGAV
ncbi:flagellar protein FliT [Pseudoduganella chitinolytica]|uniref:Flagellar protein FliT n=1 Tax=Pseudoduganella chitinolytica TaxID=34070 RepID=A0ABY8BBQ8_9BURK|nr:flagellar protein FliT [Pseudoduganella chitinolytica]WEF33235.1 flagellar protein FliT [Pseudoduganella chitinolytica]